MRLILLLLFLLPGAYGYAQHDLSGRVLDARTGEALAGATVLALGTNEGVSTDERGIFYLRTSASRLRFSYVGYRDLEYIIAAEEDFLTITLLPENAVLNAVEVVADKPAVPLRTPATVAFLDKKELDRDDGLILVPALNRIPGVYMQSGSLNTNRITIRGIGNRSPFGTAKIRAYLDNIPLTNGVGETTIEDFDLSLIEGVEVWKGPSASTLGASLGGVILLKPFAEPGETTPSIAEASLQAGAWNTWRQVSTIRYANPDGNVQLHLNYSKLSSDGYRENNELRRDAFSLLGRVQPDERHTLSAIVNYTDSKAFIPSSISLTAFRDNPRQAAANWLRVKGFEDYDRLMAGLSHRFDFWKNQRGEVLSSSVSFFSTSRGNYESRPFNILREENRAAGYRAVLEYRKGATRRLPNAAVGVEYFNELYNWQTNATKVGVFDTLLSDNRELRRYYNGFAELNWDLGLRWTLAAGLNLNATRYELQDYYTKDGFDRSGDYAFDPVLSPRLSAAYRMHPQATLFATASHGLSAPTLEETLAPSGALNPDIQPEKGWNLELGSRGNYLGARLSYELALYVMFIRDLLVARRTDFDQFVGINAGKTRHQGLEAFLRYRLLEQPWSLETTLAYTYADYVFVRFVDGDKDYSGNRLTGQPPHHIAASLDARAPWGAYASLNYEFVDAFPIRDDNTLNTQAYHLLHFKMGWQHTFGRWSVQAFGGVQNLTDARYASMIQVNALATGNQLPRYYYPGLPRNGYGGMQLQFRFQGERSSPPRR